MLNPTRRMYVGSHGREDVKSGGINSRHVREIQEWMLKQLELARRGEKNGNRREKGSFEMDDMGDDRNSHRSVRHRSTLRASDIARAIILPPSYSVHRLENHAENRDRPPARASCPKYGRVGWDTVCEIYAQAAYHRTIGRRLRSRTTAPIAGDAK
ncbi:hypothetical protein C8R43DRAFT_563010 [Mycena crocata]|nr:hypothetical protein C8R43DRAFT_563010 [Mycena crocata]